MQRIAHALLIAAALSVAGSGEAASPPGAPQTPDVRGTSRHALAFSRAERGALSAGEIVSRPVRFARGEDGWYIGGVSYQVVRARPDEVLAALADVDSLPQVLPRTHSAKIVSRAGSSARVELVQGRAPFLATYTVHLERDADGAIRFWLDPSRPHDVRDVWGFFRAKPFGRDRTLVTVAVALDLGPGLARMLFEDRIERTILRSPERIRAFVEPRALAAR